jgi:ribosomal protein S12 methylthiotransferase
MKGDNMSRLTRKRVAVVTNNLHCGRHVQYFSTIEKYFRINGWEIAGDFNVNKIVICACGFHDAMVEKIRRTLDEIRASNFLEKNIIIMACLTKTHREDLKRDFRGEIVELHREELLDGIIRAKVPYKEVEPVNVFTVHEKCNVENKERKSFHIKISEGCLMKCTFCVIKKAKGYIESVPFETIAAQVRKAVRKGMKNIKLMGEDTFAYGVDSDTNIIELVKKLKAMEPELQVDFGYLHIRWLIKYAEEIIDFCKKGILNELQIGLQHVNDEMLAKMGRPEKFSGIYDVICRIKKERPDFYMIADILVGFPGETDEMFDQLVEFFKKDRCFNKVKHFGYSDVKGASSYHFKDKVPADKITFRWDCLDKVLGERAYSDQDSEERVDNETFRITRFDDYSFCLNTFDEEVEEVAGARELTAAAPVVLEKEKGDFEF